MADRTEKPVVGPTEDALLDKVVERLIDRADLRGAGRCLL